MEKNGKWRDLETCLTNLRPERFSHEPESLHLDTRSGPITHSGLASIREGTPRKTVDTARQCIEQLLNISYRCDTTIPRNVVGAQLSVLLANSDSLLEVSSQPLHHNTGVHVNSVK